MFALANDFVVSKLLELKLETDCSMRLNERRLPLQH
ncbi:MAG: hypothetical protein RIS65_154 [Pseudomonadota bacterium]|jgi:hypothetical protein